MVILRDFETGPDSLELSLESSLEIYLTWAGMLQCGGVVWVEGCGCGGRKKARGSTSCNCLHKEKHGM